MYGSPRVFLGVRGFGNGSLMLLKEVLVVVGREEEEVPGVGGEEEEVEVEGAGAGDDERTMPAKLIDGTQGARGSGRALLAWRDD